MSPSTIAALAIGAFVISCLVTYWLIGALAARGVMDRPNERSSHTVPTPRGGGLGILAGAFAAWLVAARMTGVGNGYGGWSAALGLVLLAAVSWWDDRAPLPWRLRLAVQVAAVAGGLGMFVQFWTYAGSPERAAMVVALGCVVGVAWLGFINAFNFMDGIDGIAATEAIFVAGGAALAFAWLGSHSAYVAFSLTLGAAAAGFLVWNRPPARIFMGDVGSVPIGLMLGFLLVTLAVEGAWGAAVTLPAYFGADALLTLIRRWRRGARLTEAHREHAYQRASGREKAGHASVLWRVAVADAALIVAVAIGLWVGGNGGQALTVLLGTVIVGALLFELERLASRPAAA